MPHININNCNYYYEIHGDEKSRETIVFAHGLLWSGKLFHKQVAHLKSRYRIVTYDHRGQGQSEITESGYYMDSLYNDAVDLILQLQLGQVHFVGLSMGGFIGMRIAARNPELLKSLILIETSAQDEPNTLKYNLLNTIVKLFGVKSVGGSVMPIMFGKTFLTDSSRAAEKKEWLGYLESNPKTITRAVNGVISRRDVVAELKNIQCPVLIMVGTEDKATVPAKAEFIHAHIPHSQLCYIQHAGHSSTIEEPQQVNKYLDDFLMSFNQN
jgi:3-oxoadipate enol-lactonase